MIPTSERRPGTIAIVVVLSLLLALSLLVCFALCICIILNFIENEKGKYRRAPDSPAGGGISYQSQESVSQIYVHLNFFKNKKRKYRRAPVSPAGGGISYQVRNRWVKSMFT